MSNTAVITFGRFNPITVGHEKLVNTVKRYALNNYCDPYVYLSHSCDKQKNPIPYHTKLRLAHQAFGDVVVASESRNIVQIAQELQKDYDNLVLIVGKDRVSDFQTLLQKYNGIDYTYDIISVLSAGDRDPDSSDIEGMSATKLRQYAINNDVKSFAFGLPIRLKSDASYIMDIVRKGLNYE